MPEKWTGLLIGRMHNERITYDELAKELGVTKSYVSMILNGRRAPNDACERMNGAVDCIIQKRAELRPDTEDST